MRYHIYMLSRLKLVGHSRRMSLGSDQTPALFRGFMPHRNEIAGRLDTWVYDLRVYPPNLDFADFGPTTEFTKWAAVAVNDSADVPDGLDAITIPGGLYACFQHRGPATEAPRVFGYIFHHWLPTSGYSLDDRPHFETMPENYDPRSPDAEEIIWIPIKSN